MLTRMTMKFGLAAKLEAGHAATLDYKHGHRCAEHEHEEEPEPDTAPDRGRRSGFLCKNRPAGGLGR